MSEHDKKEIFLSWCGCSCPDGSCHNCDEDGDCSLEEPWYDCPLFIEEHADEIIYAQEQIEEEEEEEG